MIMVKKEKKCEIRTSLQVLDKYAVSAIIDSAKTTRSDPFGHGGF
jgi:hypothetical protein